MSLILNGTTGISDVDGTAAAPAIRGTDTNTGIFFPAADTIGFSEGGVEAMRINSSGQLLIGATSSDITGKLVAVVGSTTNGFAVQNDGSTGTFFAVTTGAANGNVTLRADARSGNYPPMLFDIGASERARFNTTGAFVFAGGTTTADGIGITFPATQSASSDANTLDDYEEGTFTVSLVPSSSGSITLKTTDNLNKGYYTKIGKSVTINGKVQADSVSSPNGFVTIQGLPFASDSTTNHAYACSVFLNSTVSANVGLFSIYMNEGATQLLLVKNDGTTQQLNSAQQFQASTILYFSATYFVS